MGATMPGRIHRVHSPSSRRCFVHLGCAPRLISFPTTGSILHIPRALTHSLALSNAQKLYHLTFLRIHYPHVIFAFTVSLATVISNVIDPLYPRRLIILESTCIIHATSSICLCLAKSIIQIRTTFLRSYAQVTHRSLSSMVVQSIPVLGQSHSDWHSQYICFFVSLSRKLVLKICE